jgi:hypothetical protein
MKLLGKSIYAPDTHNRLDVLAHRVPATLTVCRARFEFRTFASRHSACNACSAGGTDMNLKMALLIASVCTGGAALAEEPPRHVYRLDFTINESDAAKPPNATTCTLNLEEKRSGEIKLGSNISLPGNPSVRTDVGLLLHASYIAVGEDLLVDNDVEITAAANAQSFRKMSAKGNALVTPGKPALVASVEDPISHRRYQVMLTASKLR